MTGTLYFINREYLARAGYLFNGCKSIIWREKRKLRKVIKFERKRFFLKKDEL